MGDKLISFFACLALFFLAAGPVLGQDQQQAPKLKGYITVKPASHTVVEDLKGELAATGSTSKSALPLFTYSVESDRDGNRYTGVIVGADPFHNHGNRDAHVKTFIIPVITTLNSVGVNFDSKTLTWSTTPGVTVFDPTTADTACLGNAGNNVPLTLLQQSPLVNNALFDVGGTIVGKVQYTDSLQRAEFWNALGEDGREDYHLRLDPVVTLSPIRINIPATAPDGKTVLGVTLPSTPFASCNPLGIIDFNFFDKLIQTSLLPAVASQGVGPDTFPIFLFHNVVTGVQPLTSLLNCCFLGYHSSTSTVPFQTYSPLEFDTTGLFGAGGSDTSVMSHEVAEWANDPFGDNLTPAWGGTGQVPVGFCQNNLEVGDPLTGSSFSPIVMPNGFTYHLQELTFFSWFYTFTSVGIHGWFSNNGTFLSNAGPVCVSAPSNGASVPPTSLIPHMK